jgi:hypothetical protein
MLKIMRLIEILFKHESRFTNSQNEMRHNAGDNRAAHNYIVRQVLDERQADAAPVE